MVLLLNLIRYSLSLHPCPVSLKWSDWSVMWNHTGFPSSIPAEDQESPAPCQNVSNAHKATCFLTGVQHFQSVTSQSANTPNGWPHSGKSRVGDSGLFPVQHRFQVWEVFLHQANINCCVVIFRP